jgi:hypothetical protein
VGRTANVTGSDSGIGEATQLPVVLLSHRGPVSFGRDESGRTANRGAGGLVTALIGANVGPPRRRLGMRAATDEDPLSLASTTTGRSSAGSSPRPSSSAPGRSHVSNVVAIAHKERCIWRREQDAHSRAAPGDAVRHVQRARHRVARHESEGPCRYCVATAGDDDAPEVRQRGLTARPVRERQSGVAGASSAIRVEGSRVLGRRALGLLQGAPCAELVEEDAIRDLRAVRERPRQGVHEDERPAVCVSGL